MDTELTHKDKIWDIIDALMDNYETLSTNGKLYLVTLMEYISQFEEEDSLTWT